MGCNQSNQQAKPVQTRRRLSVGHVDATKDMGTTETEEEDRGLITTLNQENVLELIKADNGGRKFSIGSQTDESKMTSFANKKVVSDGEAVDPTAQALGFTCRKGLKPESPNQDSWMVLKVEQFSIYGVFDGHGQKGHDVSQYTKETLPKLILRDQRFRTDGMQDMLVDVFKKTQSLISTADRMKKLSAQMSGTTCTICIHDHENNKITVAHVADSTCVLGKQNKDGTLTGKAITRDHKPDLKDERQRIERMGGRVIFDGYCNHRVYAKNGRYPGLNMSRCLGDLMGHADAGCSCEPEVTEIKLTDTDYALLLCSDGVWEFITPQQAVEMVAKTGPKDPMDSANKLAKEAWDRWIREEGGAVVDDITVILVYLQKKAE